MQSDIVKPAILDVLQSQGIEIKQRGKSLWACCPLHSEKTASFKIDPARQSFHCFGCGESGDSIAFIQKYKNLSFKEALRYLGVFGGRPTRADPRQIKKRQLVAAFRVWVNQYHAELCAQHRALQKAKTRVKTTEDLEALTPLYHKEPLWVSRLEILESRDDEAKYKLYTEVTGNAKGL